MALGSDGAVWFAEQNGNKIGRITTAGIITEYSILTAGSEPYNIVAGPDGNLWFCEYVGNKIGQITTAGVITEFVIPTPVSGPDTMTSGPDGALWFTEEVAQKVGFFDQSHFTRYFKRIVGVTPQALLQQNSKNLLK